MRLCAVECVCSEIALYAQKQQKMKEIDENTLHLVLDI